MNGRNLQGQQLLILPEGASRLMGKTAHRVNIAAARAVAETVKTTLGPKGMDKMLVDTLGDIVVTNDGVTILEEMEVEHPAAKMIVEVAKAQEDEVGDGTTTAVVIAGGLLKEAEELLDQDIHPTIIANGYRLASVEAQKILDKMAIHVKPEDKALLKQLAKTSMAGRGTEQGMDHLAELCVSAVGKVTDEDGVDIENIKIDKKAGGSLEDSVMIDGVIIDKERVHSGMAKKVKKARIALLDTALEVKETETDAEIRITSPDQLEAFLKQEEKMLRGMVDAVVKSGANVVLCQKGIDDVAQHFLAKKGIFAIRRVKKSDMEKLSRATGGRVVTNLDDLDKTDLGSADVVEETKIAGESMTFVKGCKDPKAVSILIRGGTEHMVDEAERAMHDALKVLSAAVATGKIVSGGGAPEVELSMQLNAFGAKVGGREQLAISAFAKALEIIPRALAENAGLDPIDVLVALRNEHEKGNVKYGVNLDNGSAEDLSKSGVIEPLMVKQQAIKSASEAAMMILKIDDVIAASKLSKGGDMGDMPPMGGGMGGMPGMM